MIRNPRTRQMVTWVSILGGAWSIVSGCASGPARTSSDPSSNSNHNTVLGSQQNATNSGDSIGRKLDSKAVVLQLKAVAQSGKADNSSFVAGNSSIAQVKQDWGQPNTQTVAGEGTYATYSSKQAAFGFNQSGIIFDVRSYSTQVQSLSQDAVNAVLGNPQRTTRPGPNQINQIYQVSKTYQLQFIINSTSHLVDHISIFDANAVHSVSQPTPSTAAGDIRGVIEGFYGTPWTNQQRIDMLKFMHLKNLNTYVYAPKNDPYQRVDWRSPYPADQLLQMKALVSTAMLDRVQFVYSISPGMTGTSTSAMNDSITFSSPADRKALETKINQLQAIGVHTFMLSFDDVEARLKPSDQQVYGSDYPKAQMILANQVSTDEKAKDPNFELWFTPTSYYGLTDGPYWQTLRSTLNADIEVIWTGKWVLNKTITSVQAETITRLLGRKPILWDNYPVNDYTYNVGKVHDLFMGPLEGRDATLMNHLAGYISNPMLQPDASRLPLGTIAEYLQNPGGYHPMTAWQTSITDMPGITNPALFRKFAQYKSLSTLNPSGYAPIGNMIAAYGNASTSAERQTAEQQLEREFQALADLPNELPPTITDPELLHEIQPWLTEMGEEGRGGLYAMKVIQQPNQSNKQLLATQIKVVSVSPYQISGNILVFMQEVEHGH